MMNPLKANSYRMRIVTSLAPGIKVRFVEEVGECVVDSSDRLFEVMNIFPRNKPQTCIEFCLNSGYKYAGVQYGNECFCGNTAPPESSITSSSECNIKCPGDKKYKRGGSWRMNVY